MKIKRAKAATRLKSRNSRRRGAKQSDNTARRVSKQSVVVSRKRKPTPVAPRHASKIVRIMGHGQLRVDMRTLKKLKQIDSSLVEIVGKDKSDDIEFRRRLVELSEIATKNGKPVDSREIVRSDIILPSPDLGLEEAKKLFKGDGVIPVT